MVNYLFLLALPFIQLGVSYYGSVAMAMAMMLVFLGWRSIIAGLASKPYFLICVPLMFVPLLSGSEDEFMHDFLRIARQALIFVLFIGIIHGAPLWTAPISRPQVVFMLALLISFFLVLTTIQFVFLRSGIYFGFPAAAYGQNAATIPDELDLRYTYQRPAATFGEPSYLGFILISFILMLSSACARRDQLFLWCGIALACGLVSQALSFILTFGLLGAHAVYERVSIKGQWLMVYITVSGLIVLAAFGSDIPVVSRVMGGTSVTGDLSVFVRVFGPLRIVPEYLTRYPFGLSISQLADALNPYASENNMKGDVYLMNQVFNCLFEYGFSGFGILFAMLSGRNRTITLYILSCMVFNGSFFGIDKLAVVGFTIIVYTSCLKNLETSQQVSLNNT